MRILKTTHSILLSSSFLSRSWPDLAIGQQSCFHLLCHCACADGHEKRGPRFFCHRIARLAGENLMIKKGHSSFSQSASDPQIFVFCCAPHTIQDFGTRPNVSPPFYFPIVAASRPACQWRAASADVSVGGRMWWWRKSRRSRCLLRPPFLCYAMCQTSFCGRMAAVSRNLRIALREVAIVDLDYGN